MPKWTLQEDVIDNERVRRLRIQGDGAPVTVAQVLDGWRHDSEFRRFYIGILAHARFEAMFWEAPPLTWHDLDRPYECVLVDSPQLACIDADPSAFEGHFGSACDEDPVLIFPNLGNDALLVVPCPLGDAWHYAHLAAFMRHGSPEQREALLHRMGEAIETRLSDRPLWVSTSGLGVYWLHIRLDERPKYYTYAPYRTGS